MRWRHLEESSNVEDRRGQSRGMMPGGKAGGVLLLLVVMVAGYYGVDLTPLLNNSTILAPGGQSQPYTPTAEEQELASFTKRMLKSTEDTWQTIFRQHGANYTPPKMVLYSGTTQTACGYGQSAMGPFYCPADSTVYLDLSFYKDMVTKLGGGGDFALGYVLAHEVGHHVQNQTGIAKQVRQAQSQTTQTGANKLSVKMELQADCYAGVWGRYMQERGTVLEQGDLEKALRTATAIGDDRLQRQSQGRVVPDSFTHGTSEQRYGWFKRGFDTGDINQCNTFDQVR
ncbi:MAG: neutral zinc metallopeptidase [Desulfovibrionaceae bacterium]|nr:neutral zinc metallopeptidase [Desulfovibrionaceae bacterium]